MKWSEIITQTRDRLQEEAEVFYSDERLMDIARRVQAEVAAVSGCAEETDVIGVSSGVIEYALPEDCLSVMAATCDDYPLMQVDFRRLNRKLYPAGQPACFYVFGGCIGLYPAPCAAGEIKLWYAQRPPLGALTLRHSGEGGATGATVAVADGTLSLVITGGTGAGTATFDLTSSSCGIVADLCTVVNTLDNGWSAARKAGCKPGETSEKLEEFSARTALNADLLLDLEVRIPEEFQPLIELGTIYRALWKDTEYEAGSVYKQEYVERLEAMRKVFSRRAGRSGCSAVKDAYGSQAGGPRVFIP